MKSILTTRMLLVVFVFLGVFSGINEVFAAKRNIEEERRNARLRATYITRLVKFIRWDENSTHSSKPFNIIVLGNEDVGFVQSLEFLVKYGNLSVNGRSVIVSHSQILKVKKRFKPLRMVLNLFILLKFNLECIRY